jgi:hypothetical protein
VIYAGNNQGEVYIYEMIGKNEIKLVDMILIGKPAIVRNAVRVAADVICLTTEAGEILFFKYN